MSVATYRVTGMSCSHCEAAVHDEVSKLDGVETVVVSAETGTMTVTSSGDLAFEEVATSVAEAGYGLVGGPD